MLRAKMEVLNMAEQWVSVEQITQHLSVKTFPIYKCLEGKTAQAHEVGKLWRFKFTEIDDWLLDGGTANDSTAGKKD